MLGAFVSVLKAEREAMQRAVEQMDASRPGTADPAEERFRARFREQIAELDKMVTRIEARLR